MSLRSGDQLAHYRLLDPLGEGGMGVVWRALDTQLDREVAIKLLADDVLQDAARLARFEVEARAIASLNHPNIVTIHAVEEHLGRRFLVMELVTGVTLADVIARGRVSLDRFFEIAIPLTEAVGAAHARGVAHRDLKPRNIMLGAEARLKVLDFGLAELRGAAPTVGELDDATTTADGTQVITGTLPYMSPEQVQGRPLDFRTDIYSVSVILYELATGLRPFSGTTAAELIAAIQRDEPPPVTGLNPAMPRGLSRIIRHGMQKDRHRRFQTVLDLRNELEELRSDTRARPAGADPRSIAVLPLRNLSGDPRQEFFADGMTDALITDLAGIRALKVISRTSVMRFKRSRKSLPEIARELHVGAVVEGSVARAGDRVRITAQLIDARTDQHLWADTYEREAGDILALQSEVARAIAGRIRVTLTPREQSRLESPAQVNPLAHEAYLRGRYFWHQRTPSAVRKGLACFSRAVELDPGYARAYTGIADSHIVDGGRFLGLEPGTAYERARQAAQRAVELDDELAEAHTSLAAVMTDYDWDWEGADREYRRAIELNPGYVTAHSWYAEHLMRMGRADEAVEEARLARSLDPLSLIANTIVAWILFFARRYDDAILEAHRALELDAGFAAAHRILGWAYEETGQYERAIAAHEKATELSGNSANFRGPLARAYALAGRRDEAELVLAELKERARSEPVSCFDVCLIELALGKTDEAIACLERAYAARSDHVPYLLTNPRLDALRPDARFQAILKKMNFPVD